VWTCGSRDSCRFNRIISFDQRCILGDKVGGGYGSASHGRVRKTHHTRFSRSRSRRPRPSSGSSSGRARSSWRSRPSVRLDQVCESCRVGAHHLPIIQNSTFFRQPPSRITVDPNPTLGNLETDLPDLLSALDHDKRRHRPDPITGCYGLEPVHVDFLRVVVPATP
jgi:hypothetical protein